MLGLLLALVIVLISSACTVEPTVTDIPFQTATPRPFETRPAPDEMGDVTIPLDFTGGEPIILRESPGTFDLAISGEFIAQWDQGTVVYNYLPNSGALPARNQLYIAVSDTDASQQLSFEFPPEIATGQYPLVALADYEQSAGVIAVTFERLVFDGVQSSQVDAFTEDIAGTLTLTTIGEAISGQFQFSVSHTETSDAGEIDVQTVEITGRFDDVPYQITLDDPFELDVPLPTRNFTGDDQ
ncbi:MAG: hypothetical protein ACFE0Q_16785 [Anaerolineae bacterium]